MSPSDPASSDNSQVTEGTSETVVTEMGGVTEMDAVTDQGGMVVNDANTMTPESTPQGDMQQEATNNEPE